MRWPAKTTVTRVDGSGCLIVLKGNEAAGKHFFAENLSDFLRAAHVNIVASLDRYVHEVVLQRIIQTLGKSPRNLPGSLKKLCVPILAVREAVKHAGIRKGKGGKIRARPMTVVKKGVAEVLYQHTYQTPEEISDALAMVGIKELWKQCGATMGKTPEEVRRTLNQIVRRRNRIVHEGDIVRKLRGGRVQLHETVEGEIQQTVRFVSDLVKAIDKSLP